MTIRKLDPNHDTAEWLRMRLLLWADGTAEEYETELAAMLADPSQTILVCPHPHQNGLCGFLEMSTRHDYVEGCDTSPVGYIEGWYVDEAMRRQGIGRALFAAGEAWARSKGLTEIGSDTELDNEVSLSAHTALGYEVAGRNIHFRKQL